MKCDSHMKKVRGYLTNDDVFFETKEEAELHEATRALELSCSRMGLRTDAVMTVIDELTNQIERYINAKRRANKHPPIDNTPEGDNVSLLELAARGDEPVSDIRDGERTKTLRYDSSLDGFGSRRDNASSVRRGEDLATVARPGFQGTLGPDSEEDIWK